MTSRKNRPVLYEVIRRSGRGGGGWLPRSSALARELPRKVEPAPAAVTTGERSSGTAWIADLFDGHLRFTLSYPVLAAIAVGAIVLLAVTFEIGRRVGGTPAADNTALLDEGGIPGDAPAVGTGKGGDEPLEAVKVPPRSETLAPRQEEPTAPTSSIRRTEVVPADTSAGKPERPTRPLERGMSYVQVQIFALKDRDRANAAAQFLISRGVDCCLLTRKADIVLMASQPFHLSSKDPAIRKRERAAADALEKKIRELGKEYFKIGGYRFEFAEAREMK